MTKTGQIAAVALAVILLCTRSNSSQPQDGQAPPTQTGTAWTVPPGQKFILQLETALHTRTTRKGDKVEFSTTAEVTVDNRIVIPNKSRVLGTVTKAKRAGRVSGRSEIQLRLNEVQLADQTVVPLHATIIRVDFDPVDPAKEGDPSLKGDSGSGGDIGTIGKAGAQGAIIGVLSGGVRGAAIGSVVAVAITAAGMIFKRGPDLDLPRNTMLEARFDQALSVPASALPPPPSAPTAPAADSIPAAAQTPVVAPPDTSPQRPRLTRNPGGLPPGGNPPAANVPDTPPVVATPTAAPPRTGESQPAAAGGFKLSVSVPMVLVDAVVKDRGGRMMENLTRDDFIVFEDGVRQQVQEFSRDELPLAIALVIDRSGSEAPFINELRRIAESTLNELKPEDEVALVSFASDVVRIQDLTTDRRKIADGIASIRAGGGTNIVDALYQSVKYLAMAAPGRRHAVILISDNQNTVSPSASETETIKVAMESETVVYSLKTQGVAPALALQLPSLLAGAGPVGKITQETGGEIINANVARFHAALGSIIAHLRLRYCIGYYPSGTSHGAFHSIVVRLDERLGKPGSDYFIHARRGYYATTDRR